MFSNRANILQINLTTKLLLSLPNYGISFIPYPRKSPITRLRGHRGRQTKKPFYINQSRPQRQPCISSLNSSRFFQKNPAVVYSCRLFHLSRTFTLFLKTASGLIYVLRNLKLSPFSYFFYNYRGLVPKHQSYYTTYQLLFLKIGARLVNIRDIFLEQVLFAVAFGSFSVLSFFDRWSGFLTIVLPSGMVRLFFFLSRADYWKTPTNTLTLNTADYTKRFVSRSKAGTSRLCGRRPKVRGVAKNPVDHPHGGRTKSIKFQQTPWGKPAKLK
uniref:ribosomal protein L2 n=1 Tax=Euplotes vannus TaxID=5939 RepID=UPI002E777CB7|nr:ribosomal protein L2 [Euplotes vannus]UPM52107.1 ribosomal protein L2 [Euplotes vannus]